MINKPFLPAGTAAETAAEMAAETAAGTAAAGPLSPKSLKLTDDGVEPRTKLALRPGVDGIHPTRMSSRVPLRKDGLPRETPGYNKTPFTMMAKWAEHGI